MARANDGQSEPAAAADGASLRQFGNGKLAPKEPLATTTAALSQSFPLASSGLLRGDHDVTAAMEILQIGYLHAVVSAARCSLGDPRPDRRLDWVIHHQSESHVIDNEVDLKVALKATAQLVADPAKGSFPFRIENSHLKYLNFVDPHVHKILVVMTLPRDIDSWIKAAHDVLEIRHCCYWVNLAGVPLTGGEKTTVPVPTSQVFDHRALCGIMQRIGSGGKP